MSGFFLLLRLAVATAIVLAPGWTVARAIGLRGVSVTLAWSLALIFGALAVTFAIGAGLGVTLVLLLASGLVAAPFAIRARPERAPSGRWKVAAAGGLLGLLLWHVAGAVGGDGLFHLARVRKLVDFGDLSLKAVGEFADGGLHPGYAFPLWHGFLALVAKVALVDPADVVLHEPTVLVPHRRAGGVRGWARALPGRRAGGRDRDRVGRARHPCAGHGGAYTALALPATASRQILVPAALALAIGYVASPSRAALASTAAAGLALAVVHPTYALFLWLPFGGFLVVRWLWTRAGGAADRARARRPRRARRAVPALAPARGSRHRLALAGARPRLPAGCASTPDSSTSARRISTRSRRRCSGGAGRSRSRRCSSCRSPRSRPAGAGPPTSSAARSR